MAKIWEAFSSNHLIRNISIMVGGAVVAQAITVAVSPILTRLYTPAEFGTLAVYGSILAILVGVAAVRYDFAIPLPEHEDTAANLLILALVAVLVTSVVIAVAILLLGSSFFSYLGIGVLYPYWYLLPLGICGAGAYSCFNYWAIRERTFKRIARTKFSQSSAAAFTQVGLGIAGLGAGGLLAGHFMGQSAGVGVLGSAVAKKRRVFRKVTLGSLIATGKRYRRFPLLASWGTLLNNSGLYIPAIALAIIYGPEVAGFFALAERMVKVPMTLIGNSATQVYMGEAAETLRRNPTGMSSLFTMFALRLFAIGLIPAATIIVFGPHIFGFIFGSEWTTSGQFAQALAVAFVVRMAASPLSQTLNLLEKLGLQLIWEAGRALAIVMIFMLAHRFQWVAGDCVVAYSGVMAVSYGVILSVSWAALNKLDPIE
jgi:O-antigen/teichoic acid export membrane protein